MDKKFDGSKRKKSDAEQLLELWETNINLIAKTDRVEPREKNAEQK